MAEHRAKKTIHSWPGSEQEEVGSGAEIPVFPSSANS
jgi:hypothetical protein